MSRAASARGAYGESRAEAWYRERGYEVLARNWRCSDGELDLVLRRGGTVVFCEVKARRSHAFGSPAEAVGRDKQRRIRRLAVAWLESTGQRAPDLRFDVVSVTGTDVEVLEGAF